MSTHEGAPPPGSGAPSQPLRGQVLTEPAPGPADAPAEPLFGRHPHFCTGCGNPVGAVDAFCPNCGRGTGIATTAAALPVLDQAAVPAAPLAAGVAAPSADAVPLAAAPPAAPPAPPPAPATVAEPPNRPAWLLPALIGFGAVLAVLLVVGAIIWVSGRGSEGGGTGRPTSPDGTTSGYLGQIRGDYGLLTRSATSMGNTLATAAAAKDVAVINAAARRQLQAATTAYNDLAAMPVAASDKAAQTALVAAAAAHRRYLAALARAISVAPSTGLRQVPAIGRDGRDTVAAYRRFLALAPGAPTAITTAGLADTSGLTAALTAKAAFLGRQAAAAARAATPPPVADTSTPGGFSSPAGTTFCEAFGSSVVCTSAAGSAAIDQSGPAYYTGSTASGGYGTLPYGTTWTNGSIWCEITESAGTHCQNPSRGEGYFYVRKQDIRLG